MPSIEDINLKVVVLDSDYYALQAINSYLAWDRRTRVMFLADSLTHLWEYLRQTPNAELPDVIVIDADHLGGVDGLQDTLNEIWDVVPEVMFVCLAQFNNPELVQAAAKAGARAFLLKHEVKLNIAWAVCYSLDHDFVVTPGVARTLNNRFRVSVLPPQRTYPEMTERIRQAIKLCVIEGMPAHLAADEMGISLHTIRGYIRDGYRILEAYEDDHEYPIDMTPQERAFMRFTALETTKEI